MDPLHDPDIPSINPHVQVNEAINTFGQPSQQMILCVQCLTLRGQDEVVGFPNGDGSRFFVCGLCCGNMVKAIPLLLEKVEKLEKAVEDSKSKSHIPWYRRLT